LATVADAGVTVMLARAGSSAGVDPPPPPHPVKNNAITHKTFAKPSHVSFIAIPFVNFRYIQFAAALFHAAMHWHKCRRVHWYILPGRLKPFPGLVVNGLTPLFPNQQLIERSLQIS
jgi:hypothetical protein